MLLLPLLLPLLLLSLPSGVLRMRMPTHPNSFPKAILARKLFSAFPVRSMDEEWEELTCRSEFQVQRDAYYRGLCEALGYLRGKGVHPSLLDEAHDELWNKGKGVHPGLLDDELWKRGKGVHPGPAAAGDVGAGEEEGEQTKKRKGEKGPSSASSWMHEPGGKKHREEKLELVPQFQFRCDRVRNPWESYSKQIQKQLHQAVSGSLGEEVRVLVDVGGWEYGIVLHPETWPPLDDDQPEGEEGVVGFQIRSETGKTRLVRLAIV